MDLIPRSGRSSGEGNGYWKEMGIGRKWDFLLQEFLRKKKKKPKNKKPTPVFLPGEFHGQRSLVGYSWWDHRVRQDWGTDIFTFIVHRVQVQRDGGIEDLLALTIWTSIGKVMSVLFNMLSVFVIGIVWVTLHMKAKMNIYDLDLKNDSVVFLV